MGLLLCFVRQGQSSFQSRAVHSPLLSECCAQCPPKYNGFPSAWREQARPQPCVSAWHCCSSLGWVCLPWAASLHSGTEGRSASSPWGLLQVPGVLSAQRSPLWYPVLQTLSALVFADSPLHPHNSRESVWLHLISSSLCCNLDSRSGSKLGQLIVCFDFSGGRVNLLSCLSFPVWWLRW